MNISVTSTAFEHGQTIPRKFSCEGENVSPPLAWGNLPTGTRSAALIADDPDAPGGTWVHWVIYNIPSERTGLLENVVCLEELAEGCLQGINDFKKIGYGGPCPPRGSRHRYYFKLYALDTKLELSPGITKKELLKAMEEHIIAKGALVGMFSR